MTIYSSKCVNPEAGFDIQEDGSMKPRKLGYNVLTLEECDKILKKRKIL